MFTHYHLLIAVLILRAIHCLIQQQAMEVLFQALQEVYYNLIQHLNYSHLPIHLLLMQAHTMLMCTVQMVLEQETLIILLL